jgi:predicted DNA-binding protein (MmcQ/YjbR family)
MSPKRTARARCAYGDLAARGTVGEVAMVEGSRRDSVIATCSAKPGSVEDYAFGDAVAVFKVAGRMFALVPLDSVAETVSLKCEPELAGDLRARYPAITPGYHLNKRHWNTVALDGSVPDDELLDMIDHSYELVVARLPRAERSKLAR